MSGMPGESRVVVGGVDTNSQTHHAAVIDRLGREISDGELPATAAGSWRKTSSSTSLDAEDRPSNHSQPRTQTEIR